MSITLSDSAVERVNFFLSKHGKEYILRLGVRKSGCYGMTYLLEFVNEILAGDIIVENKGVRLAVDNNSLRFLNGIKIDFVKEGLNEGFKFTNPNTKYECGCGVSFSV